MRNVSKTHKNPQDGLVAAGKGMHKSTTTYKVYHSELTSLKSLFDNYTNHTDPCALESLSSTYPVGDSKHVPLYDLYDSERKFLKELRTELFEKNNEIIFCPICNSTPVQDLDHYIPRSIMPEYSVHYYNLIPICHQCNKDKDNIWLNSSGKRIFFNAYFDPAPNIANVLDCQIFINSISKCIMIKLFVLDEDPTDTESTRISKSTANALGLVKRYWQTQATQTLKAVCKQFVNQYKARKKKPKFDKYFEEQKNVLKLDLKDTAPFEIITNLVKEKILDSIEFKQWVKDEIIKDYGTI